jgi:hypothetical protein
MERWASKGIFDKNLRLRFRQAGVGDSGVMEWARKWEHEALRQSSLWWVKGEMLDLVTAAAKSIPDDIYGHEVPKPGGMERGLAVLAKPWMGRDAVDGTHSVMVHALVWGPTEIDGHKCRSLSAYQYFDFAGGLGPNELQDAILTGAIFEASSEDLGSSEEGKRAARLRGGSWIHLGRSDWPMEDPLTSFEVEDAEAEMQGLDIWGSGGLAEQRHIRRESLIEDRRFFAAFAVLVNNKISEAEMIYSPRVTRRRAERQGVDPKKEPSHVRLIKLREVREKHEPEVDEEGRPIKKHIEYSHRFLVTHTKLAWRACGPGGTQRRLVYIPPYIKGPHDKPLIIKDEVRVWTR